jgi:hypothetical protein
MFLQNSIPTNNGIEAQLREVCRDDIASSHGFMMSDKVEEPKPESLYELFNNLLRCRNQGFMCQTPTWENKRTRKNFSRPGQ